MLPSVCSTSSFAGDGWLNSFTLPSCLWRTKEPGRALSLSSMTAVLPLMVFFVTQCRRGVAGAFDGAFGSGEKKELMLPLLASALEEDEVVATDRSSSLPVASDFPILCTDEPLLSIHTRLDLIALEWRDER